MEENEYLSLPIDFRKTVNWKNPLYFRWWMDLMFSASREPLYISQPTAAMELSPGHCILSLDDLRKLFCFENENGDLVSPSAHAVLKFLDFIKDKDVATVSTSLVPDKYIIFIKEFNSYSQSIG